MLDPGRDTCSKVYEYLSHIAKTIQGKVETIETTTKHFFFQQMVAKQEKRDKKSVLVRTRRNSKHYVFHSMPL